MNEINQDKYEEQREYWIKNPGAFLKDVCGIKLNPFQVLYFKIIYNFCDLNKKIRRRIEYYESNIHRRRW